ncbi:hypothetical protein ACQKPX_11505 [Photobacterium sp. DNB23_23_1]|nr:hypothetical protein [Photobacterium sp. ZSDE20]
MIKFKAEIFDNVVSLSRLLKINFAEATNGGLVAYKFYRCSLILMV